jgi:hypothetical protein
MTNEMELYGGIDNSSMLKLSNKYHRYSPFKHGKFDKYHRYSPFKHGKFDKNTVLYYSVIDSLELNEIFGKKFRKYKKVNEDESVQPLRRGIIVGDEISAVNYRHFRGRYEFLPNFFALFKGLENFGHQITKESSMIRFNVIDVQLHNKFIRTTTPEWIQSKNDKFFVLDFEKRNPNTGMAYIGRYWFRIRKESGPLSDLGKPVAEVYNNGLLMYFLYYENTESYHLTNYEYQQYIKNNNSNLSSNSNTSQGSPHGSPHGNNHSNGYKLGALMAVGDILTGGAYKNTVLMDFLAKQQHRNIKRHSNRKSCHSNRKSRHSNRKSCHSNRKSRHSNRKSSHSSRKSHHSSRKSRHSNRKSRHSNRKSRHSNRKSRLM